MEMAASTDRKQGIRNRPPSHDLLDDRYDNFSETGIGLYVYDREHTRGLHLHFLIARSTNFNRFVTPS